MSTTETKAPENVAQPVGQATVETKSPAPAKPVETKAPDTKLPEVKLADTPKPIEAKPADIKPAEAKPAEVKTPEAPKPAEVKPAELKTPEVAAPAEVKTEEMEELAGAEEVRNVLVEMREHFRELQSKSFASHEYGGSGSYVGALEQTQENQRGEHPSYMDEEIDDVISLIYNLLDMVEYFFEVIEDGVIDRKEIQGLKIRIATTSKTYELLSERYFPDDEDNARTQTLFEGLKAAIDALQPTQPAPVATPAPVAAPPAPSAVPPEAPMAPSPAPVDTGATTGGFPMTAEEPLPEGTMGAKGPDEVKNVEPKVEVYVTQTFKEGPTPENLKEAADKVEEAVMTALSKKGTIDGIPSEEKHDHGRHDQSHHRHDPEEKKESPVTPEEVKGDDGEDKDKLPLTGEVSTGLLEVTRSINRGVRKATSAVFGDDATRKQKLKDAKKRAKEEGAAQSDDEKKMAPLREKANGMAKEIFNGQIGVLNKTGKIKKHGIEAKSMGKLHEATVHFKAARDAFKSKADDDPELREGVEKNGAEHYLESAKRGVPDDRSHHHLANMIENYVADVDTSKGVNVNHEKRFKEIEMCHKCFQRGKKLLDGVKHNEKV